MTRRTAALASDARGASLIEYMLLLGMVAIVALGAVRALGATARGKAEAQAACVDALAGCGPAGPVVGAEILHGGARATAAPATGIRSWLADLAAGDVVAVRGGGARPGAGALASGAGGAGSGTGLAVAVGVGVGVGVGAAVGGGTGVQRAPGEPSEPRLGPDTPQGTTKTTFPDGTVAFTTVAVEITADGYVLHETIVWFGPTGAVTLIEREERVWIEDGVQYWSWSEKEFTYWNQVAFAYDQPQDFRYRGEDNHVAPGEPVHHWDDTGIVLWGYERGDLVAPDGGGYVELTPEAPDEYEAFERGIVVLFAVASDEGWLAPDGQQLIDGLDGPRPVRARSAPEGTTGVETEKLTGYRSGRVVAFQADVEGGRTIWVAEGGRAYRKVVPEGTVCVPTEEMWCP